MFESLKKMAKDVSELVGDVSGERITARDVLRDIMDAVEPGYGLGYTYAILWAEDCDCGDRIMHNNGGNYHRQIRLEWDNDTVVLLDTDTSESFSGDGEEAVFVAEDSFEVRPVDWLGDDELEEADFIVNARRDNILGAWRLGKKRSDRKKRSGQGMTADGYVQLPAEVRREFEAGEMIFFDLRAGRWALIHEDEAMGHLEAAFEEE